MTAAAWPSLQLWLNEVNFKQQDDKLKPEDGAQQKANFWLLFTELTLIVHAPSLFLMSSCCPFCPFSSNVSPKSACFFPLNGRKRAPVSFPWLPVALQHERKGWGLEVAVTSFLVCTTCSKFATKCLSSVELTGEKWALSEPWLGCHEMTGIIGIHFKQPCAILLKCHIPL